MVNIDENVLNGSVALITGATSGIGRSLSLRLAERGASVFAMGRNEDKLKELVSDAKIKGLKIFPLIAEVTDGDAISGFVSEIIDRFQKIDILVNNAGVMFLASMSDCELDDWIEMVNTNIIGTLILTRYVLPHMAAAGRGDILNVSSISARSVGPGVAVYSATKKAVDVISEGMRQELAGAGVRVSSLQLGGVDTGLNEKIRNGTMKKLIKMRSNAYHDLPVEAVVDEMLHILTRPRYMTVGSSFIVPSDQAG